MSDKATLDDLNRKITEAYYALDKWGMNTPRGKNIQAEIKRLKSEKAMLPASILRQERIDNFKLTVARYRKFPDIVANRQDVEDAMKSLIADGIPQPEIDVIVGDSLDEKSAESSALSSSDAQSLLNQLTEHVKAYLDDIQFKAKLDPSYTVPEDVWAEVQTWDSDNPDKPLTTSQNKVLRTINTLRAGQVTMDAIESAIRVGQ